MVLTSHVALPSGTKVISADSFEASAWFITARIDAVTEQGAPVGFFLKVQSGSFPSLCKGRAIDCID